MLEVIKVIEGKKQTAELNDKDIWIKLTNPSEMEILQVHEHTSALLDFLYSPLDSEESSRVDSEDNQLQIIVNASVEEEVEQNNLSYLTLPIGIIILKDCIITITIEEMECIEYFTKQGLKVISTDKKTRFTLQVIYQMAGQYLIDLRRIDHKTSQIEKLLYGTLRNEYLIELLSLEKTLVYFSTALNANQKVMSKLFRTRFLKRYEEDEDLLEDAVIELKQASEMAHINSHVLRSIRDAFASIISNNLNKVMKILASLTAILTIPTMIFSFYGMNVSFGRLTNLKFASLIILLLTAIITWISYRVMKKKNLF